MHRLQCKQERQGMMFTTTTRAKDFNCLEFQLSFSHNPYENMTKLTRVTIRIVEENSLGLMKMNNIFNSVHSYCSHFLPFNPITLSICIQNVYFNIFHD